MDREHSSDKNKTDLSIHQQRNLSASPLMNRPTVSALSCAAGKFSPSQAPPDPNPTIYGKVPKNTDFGRQTAIFVNTNGKWKDLGSH